mgnify:CR=1 FL=1
MHRSSDGGDYTAMFNMINNYYKPGPATPKDSNVGHRILKPEAGRSKLDHKRNMGEYMPTENIMEGYPENKLKTTGMAVFRLKLNRTLTDILNTCVAISRSRCRISNIMGG